MVSFRYVIKFLKNLLKCDIKIISFVRYNEKSVYIHTKLKKNSLKSKILNLKLNICE